MVFLQQGELNLLSIQFHILCQSHKRKWEVIQLKLGSLGCTVTSEHSPTNFWPLVGRLRGKQGDQKHQTFILQLESD